MDVVRSCGRGFMRFDPLHPEILSPVEFFFCRPGAKIFPGYHRFATANYDSERTQSDLSLGVVPDEPHAWRRGDPPLVATGQFFCGAREKFLNGVDMVNGPQVVRDINGIPACCYPGGVIPPNLILHGLILREDGDYIRTETEGYIPVE